MSSTKRDLQVYHSQHPKCQEHVDYSAIAGFPFDILLITPARSLVIIITRCDIIPMIEGRVLNYCLIRVSICVYHFYYEPSNKRWRRCGFSMVQRQFMKTIPRNQKKDEIETLCLASIISQRVRMFYGDHILLNPKAALGLAPRLVPILAQGLVRLCFVQISSEAVLSAQLYSINLARKNCFFYKKVLSGKWTRFRVKTTLTAPLISSRLRGFFSFLVKQALYGSLHKGGTGNRTVPSLSLLKDGSVFFLLWFTNYSDSFLLNIP